MTDSFTPLAPTESCPGWCAEHFEEDGLVFRDDLKGMAEGLPEHLDAFAGSLSPGVLARTHLSADRLILGVGGAELRIGIGRDDRDGQPGEPTISIEATGTLTPAEARELGQALLDAAELAERDD